MELNGLKYLAFVKTVEYGSFTKASEILNYSQSGISRMIHDLETEWHLTLLERGRAGVRLTSEGAKLFPYAKSLCDEYEEMKLHVEELHGLKTGMIRIGTFSSGATQWLPNMIKAFQKDYPGVDYELLLGDYTDIEEWIADGVVDVGFLRLPTHPEFDTIFLEQDKLLVTLPQGHKLAKYDKVPIAALCDEPFMLLEKGAKAEVSEIFERNNLVPRVHFTTWDDYAVMAMVEKGLGVSILTQMILKRIPFNLVVKELDVPAYRNMGVALRSLKTASLAVRKFLEYLPYRNEDVE